MKKIYGGLLFLFMTLITALPVSASSRGCGVYINPLYSDLGIELPESAPDDGIAVVSSPVYYSSEQKAANYLRDAMVKRQINICFKFYSKKSSGSSAINQLIEDACEAEDTTAPDEGDYLRWHIYGCAYQYSQEQRSGGYDYTFQGTYYYHSSAEQEKMVTKKIDAVMALPEIRDAASEYETVRAIYNYVTSHVQYDYSALELPAYSLPDPSPFSAYDALCCGTAVCQGYSSLVYRMMREAGLSVRFIGGQSRGVGHAWNIVRIGGIYYNLDSTWDAGMPESMYEYFLRGADSCEFPDHTRDAEYCTAAFYGRYPMSALSYRGSSQETLSGNRIFYKLNGGVNNAANPASYFRRKVTLKAPSRAGYAFAGWYTDSKFTNKISVISKTDAADYTLYAKWEKVTVGGTKVTAYRADASGITVKYKAVSGASGYRIFYTHSSKFADGKVKHFDVNSSKLSGTVRVRSTTRPWYVRVRAFKLDSAGKRIWGKKSSIVKGFRVNYKLKGGSNDAKNPYFVYSWKTKLQKPVRKGYKFLGWYADAKYKKKVTVIKKSSKKNRTLYARWKKKS